MANLDASTAEALNALLEDERASVEMEIAFANGATELNEREVLVAMGGATVARCCALRDLLTGSGADVSLRINGIVLRILGLDRYDDRLRAFAEHQIRARESVEGLLSSLLDERIRAPLEEIGRAQIRNADWCVQRADAFAASRLLDFRTDHADFVTVQAETEMIAEAPRQVSETSEGAPSASSDPENLPSARRAPPRQRGQVGAPRQTREREDSDMG